MNRKEQAKTAFLEVFQDAVASGQPRLYALEIADLAREVSVPLTRGQRIGSVLLGLTGKEYQPHYSGRLYPTLTRLERQGVVASDWQDPDGGYPRRRAYWLAQQKTSQD